ncbi:MAG: heme-binding protein [Halalkalicoccus sp.]|nr:heme-binding protein [Halalkalicoccus sp.]
MNRRTTGLLTAGVAVIAAISAKRVYEGRSAERVPYEVVDRLDGVELRRYPRTLLVETTATDGRTAFARLFRYLGGANDASEDVEMTAPVRTDEGGEGIEIPMTAPVRTDDGTDDEVTMAFYLPAAYDPASAPVPTDPSVRLVVEPTRTLAVASFSWYATPSRTERVTTRLEETLAGHGISPTGEPFLLRYDPPLTPPFLRTNEVAVDIQEP